MKLLIKIIVILGLLYAGAESYKYMQEYRREYEKSQDRKPDVVDGLIGREAVGHYVRIKEMKDQFNLPAFKTSMVMYYTQNGRYPNSMEELGRSGDVSRDVMQDHFGNPYHMTLRNNKYVILQSAGRDKIKGTTDDIKHEFDL